MVKSMILIESKEMNRTYNHLSEVKKLHLVYMVERQSMSIKDASTKLDVNYSTAKNFFQKKRKMSKRVWKITKAQAKLSRIDQKVIKC